MASRRKKLNVLTAQYQTAILQRDAVATTAQIDRDNLWHELRVSQEQVRFIRSQIQASSGHTEDLDDPMGHPQELLYDLVVQENARSECHSISPDRSGTRRTGHIVAPTPRRQRDETPRAQDEKHRCRIQFQQKNSVCHVLAT